MLKKEWQFIDRIHGVSVCPPAIPMGLLTSAYDREKDQYWEWITPVVAIQATVVRQYARQILVKDGEYIPKTIPISESEMEDYKWEFQEETTEQCALVLDEGAIRMHNDPMVDCSNSASILVIGQDGNPPKLSDPHVIDEIPSLRDLAKIKADSSMEKIKPAKQTTNAP